MSEATLTIGGPKAHINVSRASLDIVITCDPAISEKLSAARSAITVAGMAPNCQIILLEYWVGRQGDPAKLIDMMLDLAHFWQPRVIGIEGVAYQQALKPYTEREMESRGQWHPVVMLKPDRNEKKDQRILSMQPYFRSGQIYIQSGMWEFIEEYETFPLGKTRDILDAFAYAVRMLIPTKPQKKPLLENRLAELARTDPMSARYWRSFHEKEGRLEPQLSLEEMVDEQESERFEEGIGDFL